MVGVNPVHSEGARQSSFLQKHRTAGLKGFFTPPSNWRGLPVLHVMMPKANQNLETPHYTLAELIEEFQTSEESIRTFEQGGLIRASQDENGSAFYSEFQRARLRVVAFYDALGHSAADIARVIGSVAGDTNESQQIEASLLTCDQKLAELKTRIEQNPDQALEQIEILCDQSMLLRYVEELEALYVARLQGSAHAASARFQEETGDRREKASLFASGLQRLKAGKPSSKTRTGKLMSAALLLLLVGLTGYRLFLNSPSPTILPAHDILERSAESTQNLAGAGNANSPGQNPADGSTPYPVSLVIPPSFSVPERRVPPQSLASQTPASGPLSDSSKAPTGEKPPAYPSAKTDVGREALSPAVPGPEKSASSSQAKEGSALQPAPKIQENSVARINPLQGEKTEGRQDAGPARETPISPGFSRQKEVPQKKVVVNLESAKYGSNQSLPKTQAGSPEVEVSPEAYREKNDPPKETPIGLPAEGPRQTDGIQNGTENLLASKPPSTAGLPPKKEAHPPIDPKTSEALDWLKKSNESIARNDTLETIVTTSVAIKLDPKLLQAYLNRAWAFNEKALYDKAIMDLNHALQLDPGNAVVYTRRALIFQRKGDDPRAIADYEKACQLGLEMACENYQKFASLLRD
jgi:DNA-binding transcriptional MerR regulator